MGNTTSVFDGSCKLIGVDALPIPALTAYCPTGLEHPATVYPYAPWQFSALSLNSFIYYADRNLHLKAVDEVPPPNSLVSDHCLIGTCSITTSVLACQCGTPGKGGLTDLHHVKLDLNGSVSSYLTGTLIAANKAIFTHSDWINHTVSIGLKSGAFRRSCANISLTTGTDNKTQLQAICASDPLSGHTGPKTLTSLHLGACYNRLVMNASDPGHFADIDLCKTSLNHDMLVIDCGTFGQQLDPGKVYAYRSCADPTLTLTRPRYPQ